MRESVTCRYFLVQTLASVHTPHKWGARTDATCNIFRGWLLSMGPAFLYVWFDFSVWTKIKILLYSKSILYKELAAIFGLRKS
jgi:hypothetical protein